MSEIPTLEIVNRLIDETDSRTIVDLGAGDYITKEGLPFKNDYLRPSAKAHPHVKYIAIDLNYSGDNIIEKLENVVYRKDDARNLQTIEDNSSDLIINAGCLPIRVDSESGSEMLEEIYRITKPNGIGIIDPCSEFLQILPKEQEKQDKINKLFEEAERIEKICAETNQINLHEYKKQYSEIYKEIRKIVDVPMEDVMASFGLYVIEKIPSFFREPSGQNYIYIWKKGERKKPAEINLLGAAYKMSDNLISDILWKTTNHH